MEKFNFNKKEKKPDAEQLEINFDNQTDNKKEEPLEASKNNGHISTDYDLEVIKELEKNGDIEEVSPANTEDESYINLKDLNLDNDVLSEKDDPSWDLFGRYNEIKNKKKKFNISKDQNEAKVRKAFNRDNLK